MKGNGEIAFVEPSFNSCSWPKAAVRERAWKHFPGKVLPFPYPGRAKYVWTENVSPKNTVNMRLVLDGEG